MVIKQAHTWKKETADLGFGFPNFRTGIIAHEEQRHLALQNVMF